MADEISDEELKALLSQAGANAHKASPEAAFGKAPLAYDFKRPQRISKEQFRVIENIHEQFARLLSSTLAGSMRMVIDVELAFTDQVLYGEFALSLPNPCSAYSFIMDPPGGPVVLSFAPELLMAVIDRAFGGRGQGYSGEPRAMTQIEINIVNKLVGRVFQDLEATWEIASRIQISETALETSPDFIQIAGSGDPVVLIAFEAHSANVSGLIHLCYPLATLEPLLPRLADPYQRRGRRRPQQSDPKTARAVSKMKVPVSVELARGSLPLKELAQLRSGDIIKLDTDKGEPAVVFLGSQPKFLARPGLDGKRRAVQILESIDEDEEDLYR